MVKKPKSMPANKSSATGTKKQEPKRGLKETLSEGLFTLEILSTNERLFGVFLLGAFLSMAFAPVDLPFVVFLAIPPLLVFISSAKTTRQASEEGLVFGLGHFITSLYWIGESFAQQQEIPPWLGPIAVLVLVGILSLYFALTIGLSHWLWARYKMSATTKILLFAALWVVVEQLRGFLFTGFPWNPLGVAWVSYPTFAQTGSLWGVYGLSFVTLYLAASPLRFISSPFAKAESKWKMVIPVFVALDIIGFGLARMYQTPHEVHDGVTIRLVQPNISQLDKWRDDKREGNFFDHINLTLNLGKEEEKEKPSHIIWSESAITYLIDKRPDLRQYLGDMLSDGQVLISGAPRLTRENGPLEAYNSVFSFNDQGLITASYDKAHLVPFGEYVPLRSFLSLIGLEKLVPGTLDFSAGPGPQTLAIEGLPPVSPLVCYEIIFSGNIIDKDNRPEWLLNVTNDAWFGSSSGPYQHFAMARMRAIEEGLPVVRNAGSGISGVINPLGVTLQKLDLNKRGVLDIKLPKKLLNQTTYSIMYSYFFLVFLVITLSIVLWCHHHKD